MCKMNFLLSNPSYAIYVFIAAAVQGWAFDEKKEMKINTAAGRWGLYNSCNIVRAYEFLTKYMELYIRKKSWFL